MNIIIHNTSSGVEDKNILLNKLARYIADMTELDFDKAYIVYTLNDFIKIIKEKEDSVIIFDEVII